MHWVIRYQRKNNIVIKKENKNKKIIIAYIPIFHDGYRHFLGRHTDVDIMYVLHIDVISKFRYLVKDIRAILPGITQVIVQALNYFESVKLIKEEDLKQIALQGHTIIMPDEDVMHELKNEYFPNANVIFDTTFLRWDKNNSLSKKEVAFDGIVSVKEKDKTIITELTKLAEKSSDWWRQVGAAVVKDNKVILKAYNHHVPSDMAPYIYGDPRANFNKGIHVELSSAIHAEASLIAEAASKGVSLEGTSMYVTTFPCPSCAKLIAYAGIKKIYYAEGYSMLDGESVLKERGVELFFVDTKSGTE